MANTDNGAQPVAVQHGDLAYLEPHQAASLHDADAVDQPIKPIVNFVTDLDAQEAVLDSFYYARAHVAPYGEVGKRVKKAAQYLKSRWKYIANERSLTRWVHSMIDDHGREENRLDNETGMEYDRDAVEVCY